MTRFNALGSLAAVMLFGAVLFHAAPLATAQEATPAAGMEMEMGVTFTPLGFASDVTLPDPANLIVARAAIEPGASFPLEADDPTSTMLVVEAGTLTMRVDNATWTISRGGALTEAMAAGSQDITTVIETVEMGADATLEVGDVAFVPGGVSGEVRNDGDDATSALLFNIVPAGMMAEGTPTS